MPGLSVELVHRCRTVLCECDQFQNHESLFSFFRLHAVLVSYAAQLPEAKNTQERVHSCVSFLISQPRAPGGWPFVIFLDALRGAYPGERADQIAQLRQEAIKELDEGQQETREFEDFAAAARHSYHQYTERGRDDGEGGTWLEQAGTDTDEWAFRVALAVFDGVSYEAWVRAAEELATSIRPPSPPAAPDAPPPSPRPPRNISRQLAAAGASAREELVDPTNPEAGTVRRVRLANHELAFAALCSFWLDYSDWRKPYIAWLTGLATRATAEVRTRAALVVGWLALEDMQAVVQTMLQPWAKVDRPVYRAAVGKALGIVVREPSRRDAVRGLLKKWAMAPETELRMAAARAYIYVGPYLPTDEVMAQWRVIADSEQVVADVALSENLYLRLTNPLHLSLLDAIRGFFLNTLAGGDHINEVFTSALRGLNAWADSDESKHRDDLTGRLGLPLFVLLTRLSHDDTTAVVPVLLRLVDPKADGAASGELARLFYRALRDSATQQEAWAQLRDWLRVADELPAYDAYMTHLLRLIVGLDPRGRMGERMHWYLNRWATQGRTPLPAAARALQALG